MESKGLFGGSSVIGQSLSQWLELRTKLIKAMPLLFVGEGSQVCTTKSWYAVSTRGFVMELSFQEIPNLKSDITCNEHLVGAIHFESFSQEKTDNYPMKEKISGAL